MVSDHRRRACGSAPGSAHPVPFIALLHSPLRIFCKCKVLCRPVVKVRLASHPRGEHRLTFADATEAIQVNTLRDDRWWWRVSGLRPAQWPSEGSSMIGRRRAGWDRPGLDAGPGSGTSWPHPGIRAESSAGRRAVPPDGVSGQASADSALRRPGRQVAFCAIRYTTAILPSQSVFALAADRCGAMEATWR
ncbi:hypothetical protein JOD64_003124 [Micromonospora luteifusca]|uniref:Uncharacterized protein n=1 Tax=Micromonospora luteifusca TaxID=709860 RepID=A0ABS2LVC1_9ACTN|nr:hypothetical protein [Micromonospora luteifusca]